MYILTVDYVLDIAHWIRERKKDGGRGVEYQRGGGVIDED